MKRVFAFIALAGFSLLLIWSIYTGEIQTRIGYGYANGKILPKNHAKAFSWFLRSAILGNPKGQSNVGVCYFYGYGTDQDYEKAFEFYKKSADQGYGAGQFHLGICYLEGKGTSIDMIKAVEYLEMARKQNQPGALEVLKTANASVPLAPAGFPNTEELRSFAQKGDLKSQYNLGSAYFNGWGCEPNPEEGFRWWKRSAEGGFSEGQYGVACLYLEGKGTTVDNKAAVEWLKKAAEQNNAKAQRDLGAMYSAGACGLTINYAEGLKWTVKAKDQGDAIAEYNLGHMYLHGKGVKKNEIEGKKLIQASANKGYSYAQEILNELNKQQSPTNPQ